MFVQFCRNFLSRNGCEVGVHDLSSHKNTRTIPSSLTHIFQRTSSCRRIFRMPLSVCGCPVSGWSRRCGNKKQPLPQVFRTTSDDATRCSGFRATRIFNLILLRHGGACGPFHSILAKTSLDSRIIFPERGCIKRKLVIFFPRPQPKSKLSSRR